MDNVEGKSPTHWDSSTGTYQWNATSLNVDIDFLRIGRCVNLEAMLERYMEKHGYFIQLDTGIYTVNKVMVNGIPGNQLGAFPIYELALQYVLDEIDVGTARHDESEA